jgi:hypothetical protein
MATLKTNLNYPKANKSNQYEKSVQESVFENFQVNYIHTRTTSSFYPLYM